MPPGLFSSGYTIRIVVSTRPTGYGWPGCLKLQAVHLTTMPTLSISMWVWWTVRI